MDKLCKASLKLEKRKPMRKHCGNGDVVSLWSLRFALAGISPMTCLLRREVTSNSKQTLDPALPKGRIGKQCEVWLATPP